MIDTPELDRMLAVHKESNAIGRFLDWMRENGYVIATYDRSDGHLMEYWHTIEELLAQYYAIDLKKVEAERQKILTAIWWEKVWPQGVEL